MHGNFSLIHKQDNVIIKKPKLSYHSICQINNERKILKDMSHDNIVKLIDDEFINYEYTSYYILKLEYIEGYTLNKCIHLLINMYNKFKVELSIDNIEFIIYDILKGLNYMHSMGIVHRDLSPKNIIINSNGCKLIDFGFSRYINTTDNVDIEGTPLYMAPEYGHKYLNKIIDIDLKAADIWAYGLIIYELINRETIHPKHFYTRGAFFKYLSTLKQSNIHIKKDYMNIIEKCLLIDSQERYSTEKLLNIF